MSHVRVGACMPHRNEAERSESTVFRSDQLVLQLHMLVQVNIDRKCKIMAQPEILVGLIAYTINCIETKLNSNSLAKR